jgi:hypothetical protein
VPNTLRFMEPPASEQPDRHRSSAQGPSERERLPTTRSSIPWARVDPANSPDGCAGTACETADGKPEGTLLRVTSPPGLSTIPRSLAKDARQTARGSGTRPASSSSAGSEPARGRRGDDPRERVEIAQAVRTVRSQAESARSSPGPSDPVKA